MSEEYSYQDWFNKNDQCFHEGIKLFMFFDFAEENISFLIPIYVSLKIILLFDDSDSPVEVCPGCQKNDFLDYMDDGLWCPNCHLYLKEKDLVLI